MKPKALKRLILAAHASELQPFVALGRKSLRVTGDTAYLAAGVGPVAAAFGLTHFLEDYRPAEILALGTAGVINAKNCEIGDVVAISEVVTASGLPSAYTPKAQVSRIKLSPFRKENRKNRTAPPPARAYCPQEITRDEASRALLAKVGHDVENLEAFAFAFVAKKFKIPILIFLGITNAVGKDAHAQWVKNAVPAVRRAGKIIARLT